jgi:hypothetical protein
MTGLENTSDAVIIQLISNLKSGILKVAAMGDEAYKSRGPKENPPISAVEVNMSLIGAFEPECKKRGIDVDAIEPDIRGINIVWTY